MLTNSHVVEQASEILVESSQTSLPIQFDLIAIDMTRDLALLVAAAHERRLGDQARDREAARPVRSSGARQRTFQRSRDGSMER